MKRERKILLKKRNLLIILLSALLFSLAFSAATVYAFTLGTARKAAPGKFVVDGDYWTYRYKKDNTIARNVYLKIDNKCYYFNSKGHRWCSWHTINGKKCYFGTRSQGYLIRNSVIRYKGDYYYVDQHGRMVTGWHTLPSGKTYYFGSDGKARKGKHTIKKTTYYFGQNGVLSHTGLNYQLGSDCAILINASNGKVLYAKNKNLAHANASTTKIMTCILALENCKLNEKVKFSAKAASMEPTKLYANAGEVFYLKDLLYSLMVPSHNDTAVAIAEHVSGSTAKFVKLMNKKAAELGCTNTHFATPNGLDYGYNHYTTASDMAKIARYAIKNSTFRKLINTGFYSFSSINTGRTFYVSTTNSLLGNCPGVVGMKTGYTRKAGYCFVGLCKSAKGNTYISVVLGGDSSDTRWSDSRVLMNYAYKH